MGLNYNPAAVIHGLVMYMDITNTRSYSGSGNTIYNLANGGIAGTIVSGISYDTDNRKNLNFNGSSGYMFSNNTSMDFSTSDFTIQTTVKLNGLSNGFSNAYGSVICAGAALTNNSSILQFVGTATSHYAIGLWHQPTSTTIGRNYNFQTNKIYNIAVVKNTTQVEFFVDGASIGTTSSSNFFNFTANGFAVGRWYFSGYEQYLKGNIYELKAYNRALSNDEIAQNYNAIRGRFTTPENIVTNGIFLNVDPGNTISYPGVGNTIYDLSGLGKNGILTNGPTFSAINGGSIVFDGTNDYTNFGNIGTVGNEQTIEVWFNSNSVTDYRNVFDMNNAGNRGPRLEQYSAGKMSWVWSAGTNIGIYNITSQISISSNTWLHTVITLNSGNYNCYLNGTLVESGTSSNGYTTIYENVTLGLGYATRYYSGNISQTRIYNRALSQQEILQNFNATRFRYGI